MNGRRFSLKPLVTADLPPDVKITGSISRLSNTLTINYILIGPMANFAIPASAENQLRRNALWKETCLEFFLGPKNSAHYWEFNLSPAGHWNVYRFTAYRQGMQEEPAYESLPFSVLIQATALHLSLELDLGRIISQDQTIEVGISAVIKAVDGTSTFWALLHPGTVADFHRRDSFIIDL
jgi:hypothetical protein